MANQLIFDDPLDLNEIKTDVLERTALYAYEGKLDRYKDIIPYEIIPGRTPKFRCCVHREREIIRQRVVLCSSDSETIFATLRLNRQDHPEYKFDENQIVHVIPSACEGCPIEKITVTSNCHSCLAQRCVKACKFDAIIRTPNGAVIDKKKCVECGACAKACQYKAIVDIDRPCKSSCPVSAITIDPDGLAFINEEKCINCGQCVIGCPFGAITDSSMLADVIREITAGKNVYAMVAPAIEGQFAESSVNEIKSAIKKLGFKDVLEVALGADIIAYKEAEELVENIEANKVMTSSCCPSFVNLVEKHYPELKEHVSTTVSPMVACARHVKSIDPNAVVVFIGPCITKKYEAVKHYKDEVHYVLTFEELFAMMAAKWVDLEPIKDAQDDATTFGKGFAKSGGVTTAVLKVLKEKNLDIEVKANKCNGIDECKKALTLLKAGRCTDHFIEGMACTGGCVNGPAKLKETRYSLKTFDKLAKDNTNTEIIGNAEKFKIDKINVHKH